MSPPTSRISADDLHCMLSTALSRIGAKVPSVEDCAELAVWVFGARIGDNHPAKSVSDKPLRYAKSLLGSLTEVDQHWAAVLQGSIERAPNSAIADLIRDDLQKAVGAPLARLRAALDECLPLLDEFPRDFVDDWDLAARSLHTVFTWAVQRSGSNVHAGLSKGGPAMSFVMDGLGRLGWLEDRKVTEDAVMQFLKRDRKQQDK